MEETKKVKARPWRVTISLCIGIIIGSLVQQAIDRVITERQIVQPFRKEAVDRGFASWIVTDNATGSTRFAWNEIDGTLHAANNNDLFERTAQPLPEKK